MQKCFIVFLAVSLFAIAAVAQDVPRTELFVGYTYVRINEGPSNVPSVSANGGGGQFAVNFGKWFGFVTDIGAVHNGNVGGYNFDTTMTNFMFGPRISIRKHSRVTPYFQTLFGGVHSSNSYPVTLPPGTPVVTPFATTPSQNLLNATSLRVSASQTAFAFATGGGLDIKINKSVSFRAVELDYYLTRLQSYRTGSDNNQNNIRVSTGLNFTFGAQ